MTGRSWSTINLFATPKCVISLWDCCWWAMNSSKTSPNEKMSLSQQYSWLSDSEMRSRESLEDHATLAEGLFHVGMIDLSGEAQYRDALMYTFQCQLCRMLVGVRLPWMTS
jgi:hypothetical protein